MPSWSSDRDSSGSRGDKNAAFPALSGSSGGTDTKQEKPAGGQSGTGTEGMSGNLPSGAFGGMPGGFTGTMPEGFDPTQMQGGVGGSVSGQWHGGTAEVPSGATDSADGDTTDQSSQRPSRDNIQIPDGFDFNMSGKGSAPSNGGSADWTLVLISVLVLCAGLIIAKLYKR